jgi:hypothetical protein
VLRWTRLAHRRILAVRERGSSTPPKACSSRCDGALSTRRLPSFVQTAKTHSVSTLSLADALVALAQNQASHYADDAAFVAARAAWGHLVDRSRSGRGVRFDDDAAPGA